MHTFLGMTYRVDIDKGREGQLYEEVRESDIVVKRKDGCKNGSKGRGASVQKPPIESAEERANSKRCAKNLCAAQRAIERSDEILKGMHGFFEPEGKVGYIIVGKWGVDAYNALDRLHKRACESIDSTGDIDFHYTPKDIFGILKAAQQAEKVLRRHLKKRWAQENISPKKDASSSDDVA